MLHPEQQLLSDWLAQETAEDVLEPDLAIVDPHHHLWDIRSFEMQPHASFQEKVYLCEEIIQDIQTSGHHITQTVFAQCGAFYKQAGPEEMKCVGETEFVQGIVAMSQSGIYGSTQLCAGIFGSADLRIGKAVELVLEAHLRASGHFRGTRSAFPRNLDALFMEGYGILQKLNLSYDNYSPDHERLPVLAELARAFPEVPVIVNHLGGKVDHQAGSSAFASWRKNIDAVAGCANTYMKVGGGQQRVGPWEPEFHNKHRRIPIHSEELCDLLYPYYSYVIDAFGPERCMFESNFPVDKECVSYRTLWNTFKRIAARAGLSDSEKADLFSGTAARVYRLE